MKKIIFQKMLIAMITILLMCLLVYPLLLPTENYFKLVLQVFPLSILVGIIMVVPLYVISDKISHQISNELKHLKPDSKEALTRFPELQPVVRQISSIRVQINSQISELSGKQEQMRVLTDNMQEGLLLISVVGRIISCNTAALKLLNVEEPIEDYTFVNHLNNSASFQHVIQSALNGSRESAILTLNDKAVQLNATPVTAEGGLTGAAVVLLDVTEREKRDALRREFTSNVSHELKTPLTSIYGIADMMETGMVKQEDIGGFAARIRDESARLIALIEDIIRLSRLDDESFSEEVVPIDLYQITKNVCEQLQNSADAKNIEIVLEGSQANMKGVPVIIEEMVYNVCDNAIKYNVENGKVNIKVIGTEQQTIISVSDTGIGIPLSDRERIFERFYRVDKSHSKQIGGTGLGLSIVKHGAQFHNASIEVESQIGNGTTITLYFPCNTSAENSTLPSEQQSLDITIPGETEHSLIHILEETKMSSANEEPINHEKADEAPSENNSDSPEDLSTEEHRDDIGNTVDQNESDTPSVIENEAIEPENETDIWIREAMADLNLLTDESDIEAVAQNNIQENVETFAVEEEIIQKSAEESAEPKRSKRIDIVPIDESNMNIDI